MTPFYFEAKEAGASVELKQNGSPSSIDLVYSTDGVTWDPYTIGTPITTTKVGDKVYFRATTGNSNFSKDTSNYYQFVLSKKMSCEGNIMYLLDAGGTKTTVPANAFYKLFDSCSTLTSAPLLPATTLAEKCYMYMFNKCSSLTTASDLPAKTMAYMCCYYMFNNCSSLTTAPELPATTLAVDCYNGMFFNCTSLTTAPALPATTLEQNCYNMMFRGCTSLTTSPDLSATSLAAGCYRFMFYDCSKLNSVTMLATDNIDTTNLDQWLAGTASSGKIYVASGMVSGIPPKTIPSGWTVKTTTWSVIGDFGGFNWNKDFMMTETETNVFVSPAITFKAGEQFKVRFGGDWEKGDYGAPKDGANPLVITSGTPITATTKGNNIAVPANGDYIITLDLSGKTPTITVTAAPN